MTAGYGFL